MPSIGEGIAHETISIARENANDQNLKSQLTTSLKLTPRFLATQKELEKRSKRQKYGNRGSNPGPSALSYKDFSLCEADVIPLDHSRTKLGVGEDKEVYEPNFLFLNLEINPRLQSIPNSFSLASTPNLHVH